MTQLPTQLPQEPASWLAPGDLFPSRADVSPNVLAAHLRELSEIAKWPIVARSVFVRYAGNLQHAITAVRVGPWVMENAPLDVELDLGVLVLHSTSATAEDLHDGATLLGWLHRWASPERPEAQYQTVPFTTSRYAGRTSLGDWPHWDFYFGGLRHVVVNIPDGPFYHAPSGTYFGSRAAMLSAWTGHPAIASNVLINANMYRVLVPDPRARLASAVLELDTLLLETQGDATEELIAAATAVTIDDERRDATGPIHGGKTQLTFGRPIRSVLIHLFGQSGTLYDWHDEPSAYLLRGESFLAPSRGRRLPQLAFLDAALATGESETTEFKEWIPKDKGEKKAQEFLETVTAFANADGGTIWIGVSDNAEVIGVEKPLRVEFGENNRSAIARLQLACERELAHRAATSVRPRPAVRFQWVTSEDGHLVLAAHVEPGGAEASYIEATRTAFIRRGASNVRATPVDLAARGASESRPDGALSRRDR